MIFGLNITKLADRHANGVSHDFRGNALFFPDGF
jgi:hypothetical protein